MTQSPNTNSTTSRPACQLYLITPPMVPDVAAFVSQLELALAGGPVAALQIRLKVDGVAAPDADIIALATALKPVLDAHDVALILNDRPDLVSICQADGVHVGQGDASVAAARKLVSADIQIGVTCHDSRHLAMEAGEAGADYIAFGAFFPTRTKATTAIPAPEIITWWTNLTEIPCVAIGGITPENAAPLIAAGADFIAVSSGVWDHPQGPKQAVMEFNKLF
jgi:thiamine-phosphate pyrophosphorylase